MEISLGLVLAYLIGSIPFGLILTRFAGLGDVRAIGSGNIGATNVMRTGNKKLAIITLLLDIAKGFGSIMLGVALLLYMGMKSHPDTPWLVAWMPAFGAIAVVGHVFPVWLKFKGGKGVATILGVMLGLDAYYFTFNTLIAAIVWLSFFIATRYSSLAALAAVVVLIAYQWACFAVWGETLRLPLALFFTFAGLLMAYTHRGNIERLLKGKEHRFGRTSEEE